MSTPKSNSNPPSGRQPVAVPTITTERLVLRPVRIEDADAYFEMRNDTDVGRYLLRPPPKSVDEALASLKRMESVSAWALTRPGGERGGAPGSDKLLGTIGLPRLDQENRCTSISFELRRDEWGKGLMGEAAAAIVKHAFETLKLHRIQAEIDPKNAPSIHLAESLGFVREGILRENVFVNGGFADTAIYALFNRQ